MAQTIIHKDGAFNIYCSVMDKPVFSHGVKAQIVYDYLLDKASDEISGRLSLAMDLGTDSRVCMDVDHVVNCNCAGENETNISTAEFVKRFLTLEGVTK